MKNMRPVQPVFPHIIGRLRSFIGGGKGGRKVMWQDMLTLLWRNRRVQLTSISVNFLNPILTDQ